MTDRFLPGVPAEQVEAWFKFKAKDGRGYQTDINRALREHVQRVEKEKSEINSQA
ncbi:MAG: BrnA antitoxin family protein [Dehalococcoidia bacterium]|nr:BrnA antitoxin family protein [Dehalococcoidia bacterium]